MHITECRKQNCILFKYNLRLRDFWYSLLQTVCRFWLRSIDLCPFIIGRNIFISSILVLIQIPFMVYLLYSHCMKTAEISRENAGTWIGILLPKLFWPTVRKNCSSDREKLLKFEVEGREFAKFLWSLKQFFQTVKCQNYLW